MLLTDVEYTAKLLHWVNVAVVFANESVSIETLADHIRDAETEWDLRTRDDNTLITSMPLHVRDLIRLNFTILSILEQASFLQWLLNRYEATPFLTELKVNGAHNCEVFIYWRRVTQDVSDTLCSNDKRTAKSLEELKCLNLVQCNDVCSAKNDHTTTIFVVAMGIKMSGLPRGGLMDIEPPSGVDGVINYEMLHGEILSLVVHGVLIRQTRVNELCALCHAMLVPLQLAHYTSRSLRSTAGHGTLKINQIVGVRLRRMTGRIRSWKIAGFLVSGLRISLPQCFCDYVGKSITSGDIAQNVCEAHVKVELPTRPFAVLREEFPQVRIVGNSGDVRVKKRSGKLRSERLLQGSDKKSNREVHPVYGKVWGPYPQPYSFASGVCVRERAIESQPKVTSATDEGNSLTLSWQSGDESGEAHYLLLKLYDVLEWTQHDLVNYTILTPGHFLRFCNFSAGDPIPILFRDKISMTMPGCHVSRATMQWYADNLVCRLDWPAQSPDLSPIEHLWGGLDRWVRAHQARPKSIAQLMEWLQDESPWMSCKLSEVSVERHRNARAWETEDPRGNSPTSGISFDIIPACENLGGGGGATPPGIEPGSPRCEASKDFVSNGNCTTSNSSWHGTWFSVHIAVRAEVFSCEDHDRYQGRVCNIPQEIFVQYRPVSTSFSNMAELNNVKPYKGVCAKTTGDVKCSCTYADETLVTIYNNQLAHREKSNEAKLDTFTIINTPDNYATRLCVNTCAQAQLIGRTKPRCLIEAGLSHPNKGDSQRQGGLAILLQQAQLDNGKRWHGDIRRSSTNVIEAAHVAVVMTVVIDWNLPGGSCSGALLFQTSLSIAKRIRCELSTTPYKSLCMFRDWEIRVFIGTSSARLSADTSECRDRIQDSSAILVGVTGVVSSHVGRLPPPPASQSYSSTLILFWVEKLFTHLSTNPRHAELYDVARKREGLSLPMRYVTGVRCVDGVEDLAFSSCSEEVFCSFGNPVVGPITGTCHIKCRCSKYQNTYITCITLPCALSTCNTSRGTSSAARGTLRRLSVEWVATVPHTGVTAVAGEYLHFTVAYVQALAACRATAVRPTATQLVVHTGEVRSLRSTSGNIKSHQRTAKYLQKNFSSQDTDVKSLPNLFTHLLIHSFKIIKQSAVRWCTLCNENVRFEESLCLVFNKLCFIPVLPFIIWKSKCLQWPLAASCESHAFITMYMGSVAGKCSKPYLFWMCMRGVCVYRVWKSSVPYRESNLVHRDGMSAVWSMHKSKVLDLERMRSCSEKRKCEGIGHNLQEGTITELNWSDFGKPKLGWTYPESNPFPREYETGGSSRCQTRETMSGRQPVSDPYKKDNERGGWNRRGENAEGHSLRQLLTARPQPPYLGTPAHNNAVVPPTFTSTYCCPMTFGMPVVIKYAPINKISEYNNLHDKTYSNIILCSLFIFAEINSSILPHAECRVIHELQLSSENGAAAEWKGGGNGRSPRRPADQRRRPARFPVAKARWPDRGLNPVRLVPSVDEITAEVTQECKAVISQESKFPCPGSIVHLSVHSFTDEVKCVSVRMKIKNCRTTDAMCHAAPCSTYLDEEAGQSLELSPVSNGPPRN
ncbi:hypothetical protein PR048_030513 [Dryococelus australis]|uniref:Uncharacterized protein n=1 Tax=Dryococelus australis TaxID=614101 RepID=A0ABQ9G967_9NEOP|nr:hypothetical protein PR048_030513 [Dryococelus australis]